MADEGAPISPLSENLKVWRQRRGLSLSALAAKAGLSKSVVSELERGNGNPSLDTLWSLARSLNISLGSFFEEPGGKPEVELLRLDDAPIMVQEGDHFRAQLLSLWRPTGEVELCVMIFGDRAKRNSEGNAPGIIERVLCVEGRVRVGTDLDSAELDPGDMFTFPADRPHFYHALGGPARLVTVQQYPEHS
ncbi:helix-turn-helix domain-containing protein [Agromyces silvae]|uniref:helix-turn-helix domain-containing protein n=1 Tax=Agromyces silvae TaxID=3388266 RepID=UPI00280B60A8|nr:XRE family transcriptional regulator [Agromyces protaetiae]